MVKSLPANAGDMRDTYSIPGSGRFPGGRNGNPLQYSCLENPVDRGPWRTVVHGVKGWDWATEHIQTELGNQQGELLFQIGKASSPCLTYTQSTSWETLGWKKHKLVSRLPGEIRSHQVGHPHKSTNNKCKLSLLRLRWIIEKAREFQKNIYFCFIDYAKAFDCVDHKKLWKILQ